MVPGSPAEKAGMKEGDVIVGFAGEKIQDASSFRLKVATSEVAKPYEIKFIREGKERSVSVVPAAAEKVVFEQEQGARDRRIRSNPRRRRSAISGSKSSR